MTYSEMQNKQKACSTKAEILAKNSENAAASPTAIST